MNDSKQPPALAAATVLELARLAGYANLDDETATRIAVGATQAMRTVAGNAAGSLFDAEPSLFQPMLERLGEPE
jgi:hypothetical protein